MLACSRRFQEVPEQNKPTACNAPYETRDKQECPNRGPSYLALCCNFAPAGLFKISSALTSTSCFDVFVKGQLTVLARIGLMRAIYPLAKLIYN